jgi:hypothetical protein
VVWASRPPGGFADLGLSDIWDLTSDDLLDVVRASRPPGAFVDLGLTELCPPSPEPSETQKTFTPFCLRVFPFSSMFTIAPISYCII